MTAILKDKKLHDEHIRRVRQRRVWPFVNPKPRTLLVRFGRDRSYNAPDLIFAWGEGCSSADGTMLYYAMTVHDMNSEFNEVRRSEGKPRLPVQSLVELLAERGYDLTTLRFEIQKLPEPEPPEQPEYIPNYEI